MKLDNIIIVNIMIGAFYRVQRNQEAKDLFAAIPANGLVADIGTYSVMMKNLIKEGSVEEADNLFSSMEKSGCAANSYLLNCIIRSLLEKGDVVRAGNYMSKVDGKNCSLEAKTVSLLIALFSTKGEYRKNINLLPTKYQFLEGAVAGP
jgi:pentatricopeptide repeat protein